MASENDELRKLIQAALDKRGQAKPKEPLQTVPKSEQNFGGRPQQNRSASGQEGKRTTEPPRSAGGSSTSRYRFLNPYNFIRWLDPPSTFSDDPDTQLLARCAPPPHDRYVGLTGEITCRLETVTPLFISDSEGIEPSEREPEHGIYRFFRYDFGDGEEPALPATSLRGMIRSTFEALTNSCFAHFDYDARLSYHLPANESLKLIPGRVEKGDDDVWRLRLLPGTARIAIGDRPRDKLYAARVEQYEALAPGRRPQRNQSGKPKKAILRKVDLQGLQHGDRCVALASELKFPPVWNVEQLAAPENRARLRVTEQNQRVIEGYLCINQQNIEAKRFERFFFRDPANRSGAEFATLTDEVRTRYNELIADYQQRHKEDITKTRKKRDPKQADKQNKRSAYSRFMFEEEYKGLTHRDLVYAMLSGSLQSPKVEFIVPVAVPRLGYDRKVFELLPEHLHKCEQYDHLCPACRTFGWVYGKSAGAQPEIADRNKQIAYAGRVRIEHGRLLNPEVATLERTTLAILSSPKPTTTRFYLKPRTNKPQNGLNDDQAGYNNRNNILRGRKVYRHHGHDGDVDYWQKQAHEHKRPTINDQPIVDDQNRTLLDPLAPGAQFEFTVHFENLAAVELGALLWSLQLEDGMVHRLGLAKPLGFGSVKVTVQHLSMIRLDQRYSTFSESRSETPIDGKQYVQRFHQAMQRSYGREFSDLAHIRDLRALLSTPPDALPIHYPRTTQLPHPEGKQFEWFMGNNRSGKDAGPRLGLPLADQDTAGLPLLNKYGDDQ